MIRRDLERLVRKHARYLALFPGIAPRVARNYFNLLVLRKPVLRAVEFALTYRCQAHCAHCSAHRLGDPKRKEVSTAEAGDWAAQCLALGALNINLTGGEALLREDFDAIAAACRPRSTVLSVASGGLLLSDASIRRMKRAGVSIVTISVDSPVPEEHDRFRGIPGSHKAALDGAMKVRAAGMIPFLCAVATPANIQSGDLRKLSDLAAGHGYTMTLQMACPVGRWTGAREQILSPDDRREFYELAKRPHMRWEGCSNYIREGCPAGIEKIYISPYGDVMPCTFLHVSFGNLREERLDAIWKRMIAGKPFDHVNDGCPVAEDGQFQKEVLGPLGKKKQLPLDWRKHPAFKDRE
ncbi:MAG: radical SAM protein [Deltaproteobacteria bacterium]|nr:radical SAM protein [Deltaproteobacteria bacterium]